MTTLDFTDTIRQESARFRAALTPATGRRCPTCPEWSADDLLWHLTEVQWFWSTILAQDPDDPETLRHPDRPGGHAALVTAYDEAGAALQQALGAVPAAEHRWMWAADPKLHTAGYIARRQAHEALIHRVDAELTAGRDVSAIDPELAADGVSEMVEVMYGRDHPLTTFAAHDGRVVELVATDLDRRWVLQLGRETGTVPDSGEAIDDPVFRPAPEATPTATIAGTAADLDLWLWNRPTQAPLHRDGDDATIAAMDDILSEGLQ